MNDPCPFCQIARGRVRADGYTSMSYAGYPDVATFTPLHPIVEGHRLYIPLHHIEDATHDHVLAGRVFAAASFERKGSFNLITSVGKEATQSVFHFHVHYVPRSEGDGLHLPWSSSP